MGWGGARRAGVAPGRALTPRSLVPNPSVRVLRSLGGEMAALEWPSLQQEEAMQRGGESPAVPPSPRQLHTDPLCSLLLPGLPGAPASQRDREGAQVGRKELGCGIHPCPAPKRMKEGCKAAGR